MTRRRFPRAPVATLLLSVVLAAPPPAGGAPPTPEDLRSGHPPVLTGRVVSETGEPVPDARIVQVPFPVPEPGDPRLREILDHLEEFGVEKDGSFELPIRVSGQGSLVVSAPGRGWINVTVWSFDPGEGHTDVGEVMLPSEATVVGRVVDTAGNGLADAEVRYSLSHPFAPFVPGLREGRQTATTDADGGFRIAGMRTPESVALLVSKPGYVPRAVEHLAGIRQTAPEVVLHEAATIEGTVLGAAGIPVAGAFVVSASSNPREQFTPVRTGDDGRFEIQAAWPGRVLLAAEAPGYVRSNAEVVEAQAGPQERDVFLHLRPPLTLKGRLVDWQDRPISRAWVWLDTEPHHVTTGADGSFEIDGLPEGLVEVQIRTPGRPPFTYPVNVSPYGAQVTISPNMGAIRGLVLHSDGSPAARVPFTVEPVGCAPVSDWHKARGLTGLDGSIDIDRMPPGVYRLRVSVGRSSRRNGWPVPGLIEVSEPKPPGAEPEVTEVEVRLPEPTVVRLRLSGPRSEGLGPADFASAGLLVANREMGVEKTVEPGAFGADGSCLLGPLAPGTWYVLAIVGSKDLGAFEEVVVEDGQGEIEVDLELKTREEMRDVF